jgi:hypothetical protein
MTTRAFRCMYDELRDAAGDCGKAGVWMEGNRFDDLTRALALGATRRATIKATVAGVLVAAFGLPRRRASAQEGLVPIGGACSEFGADYECDQSGTRDGGIPVICSDNDNAADGPYTCCRNAGGACGSDLHCCGTALCVGGVCGGSGGTGGQLGGSRALGASCSATSECSQSGGSVVCASNGLSDDGAKNCCRNSGGACSTDLQCCAGYYCINGRCGGEQSGGGSTSGSSSGSSGGGNLAPGESCTASNQCSQSGGSTVCGNNGIDSDGRLNCCRNEGGRCSDSVYSSDCCGGLYCRDGVCKGLETDGSLALGAECTETAQCDQIEETTSCADNGIASDGALNCCRYARGGCGDDSHCCAGLLCVDYVCIETGGTSGGGGGGGGGRLSLGAVCETQSQCSQEGGAVACDDNGIATDGVLNCCRYEGGGCWDGAGCCVGLECIDGVCGGGAIAEASGGSGDRASVGLGGVCASDGECSQEGGPVACDDNGVYTEGNLNCCRYSGGGCGSDLHCCAGLLCIGDVCTPF